MRIDDIHKFLLLEHHGNVRHAAAEIAMEPKTFLNNVRRIEKELGVTLTNNSLSNIKLTEFGMAFLPFAKYMVSIETEIKNGLLSPYYLNQPLRVGYSYALRNHPLLDTLFLFQKEDNFAETFLCCSLSNDLKSQVISGNCDIAFILEESNSKANEFLRRQAIMQCQLVAVVPANHPLAQYTSLQFSQLKDERILSLLEGTASHTICVQECKDAGFEPKIIFTSAYTEDILGLAEKNLGIGILPWILMAKSVTPAIKLINISASSHIAIQMISRRDNYSPSLFYFLSEISNYFEINIC